MQVSPTKTVPSAQVVHTKAETQAVQQEIADSLASAHITPPGTPQSATTETNSSAVVSAAVV